MCMGAPWKGACPKQNLHFMKLPKIKLAVIGVTGMKISMA